ncbi:MAG: prolyl oligopeptidase family serine peptidase [Candidatus Eremiobacteraeota bacterium]|nr:prolyl oligopeptidase family serine peptidase [Candidatus Eremiobacteraeota bacterium]
MKRNIAVIILAIIIVTLCVTVATAQTRYKAPSKEVIDILKAPPPPVVRICPARKMMMLVSYDFYPPLEFIAEPYLKLAGLRINPDTNAKRRTYRFNDIDIINLKNRKKIRIQIPPGPGITLPRWSNDGKFIAFGRYFKNGIEIWIADPKTGKSRNLSNIRLNYTTDAPFQWTPDNSHLLVKIIPKTRGNAPKKSNIPSGPIIEDTSGKVSQMVTYQDLLETNYDNELFEYYCTSQIALLNIKTGEIKKIGKPGIFLETNISPDGKYIFVTKLMKPYSHRVPYYYFPRSKEIWDLNGKSVATIAKLPASEEVPRHGVTAGPRNITWQPLYNAKLIWTDALDGGDPTKKVPFHDSVVTLNAPFDGKPLEVLKVRQRFAGFDWLSEKNQVLISDYERKKEWITTRLYDLQDPAKTEKTIFNLSVDDDYNAPGRVVMERRTNGDVTALQDGEWIYLSGKGATKKGDRPFLNKMSLKTLKRDKIFRCKDDCYESFISFVGNSRENIVVKYETGENPPNFYLRNLKTGKTIALTHFKDPAPHLSKVKKEIIRYKREDGVPLFGILYLPPGYIKGDKLPLIMWAYPTEYTDPKTAGQIRGSTNKYTRYYGCSPRFFLTRGYAVLQAAMPVVGDPDTVNNTFIKQIVANAKAAIDCLDKMGIIDPKRVLIGGHSYGAFMAAHLLGNSDLFRAGIARSGAYNRTLTPFGFQCERRTLWEAPEFYLKISPITHAHKIKEPMLIIHGRDDNNPGTYLIQSRRMFQAIKGNGGTARLVILPLEGHSYSAIESNLHVLAEMFEWADKYMGEEKAEVKK